MNRPGFIEGVVVALVASLASAVGQFGLSLFLPAGSALRLVVAALGFAYLVYLIRRSDEAVGRIAAPLGWMLAALAIGIWNPALGPYLLAHLGLVWLVRSLYFHSGPLGALVDLALALFGLAAALGAGRETHSLLAAVWCFFLVQALFVWIPQRGPARSGEPEPGGDSQRRYRQALRVAEAALARLSSSH